MSDLKMQTNNTNKSLGLVTACLMLATMPLSAWSSDMDDCRAITDAEARLACYDSLQAPTSQVEAVAPAEAPTVQSPPSAPTATGSVVLDDSIGAESIKDRKGELEDVVINGHVDSCREDRSSKYRFYFDNGQIWLQKDNRRVPWKECDFDVTIEKDFFGYKMLPKGEDRSIRISRIK